MLGVQKGLSLLQKGFDNSKAQFLGEDHMLVANSLYHLAMVQVDLGRFTDALESCHESLIRYVKTYDSSKSKSAG